MDIFGLGGGRGRGTVQCYNCGVLGHYQRDFLKLQEQCTYCITVDHIVVNCPQLITKRQERNIP